MKAIRESRIACLHRISGRAVEHHPVDNGLDPNSATNELPNGVGHVLVIASEAIDPTNHQGVTLPQDIEKTSTFGTFAKASGDARDAMVRQHQIRFKSILVSLGALVIDGLIDGANPAIKNRFHIPCPAGVCSV